MLLCFDPGELLSAVPLTPLCSHLPRAQRNRANAKQDAWGASRGEGGRRMDFRKMEICKQNFGSLFKACVAWGCIEPFRGDHYACAHVMAPKSVVFWLKLAGATAERQPVSCPIWHTVGKLQI